MTRADGSLPAPHGEPGRAARAGIAGRWMRARPGQYSAPTWLLIQGLDRLPWPVGERLMSALWVMRAAVQSTPRRQAWAWASKHRRGRLARTSLALSLLGYQGRFVALSSLVGVRRLDSLHDLIVLHGAKHLEAPGPKILMAFHLGPPATDLALRIHGHAATWIGGTRNSNGWLRMARLLGVDARELFGQRWQSARLFAAHQELAQGRSIYMPADGIPGQVAFRVSVPGGTDVLNNGWFALRRRTGRPTLPVLAHVEGSQMIVRVHPPLPAPCPDRDADADACRAALEPIVAEHVGQFPEQCLILAFGPSGRAGRKPAASADDPPS